MNDLNYQRGEWVLVRDKKDEKWHRCIFLATDWTKEKPFECVAKPAEDGFFNDDVYAVCRWQFVKPISSSGEEETVKRGARLRRQMIVNRSEREADMLRIIEKLVDAVINRK